jgi:hypothetical protein
MSSSSYVTVATYADPIHASLARNYLEENDIPVVMTDEETVSVDWSLGFALGGIKLQVAPWHLERAEFLLAQHQRVTQEREEAEKIAETAFTTPEAMEELHAEQEDRLPINQDVDRLLRTTVVGLLLWPLQLLALWWLFEYWRGRDIPSADRRWKVKVAALLNIPLMAIIIVPLVLLFGAVFNTAADPNQPAWKKEWFKAQNFSVKFPGEAQTQTTTVATPMGDLVQRSYWSRFKSVSYRLYCLDLTEKAAKMGEDKILDDMLHSWEASPKTKIVRQRKIVADGVPGLEADIESPAVGYARVRFFVWEKRQYIIEVIAEKEDALPQENMRIFFDSLYLFGKK